MRKFSSLLLALFIALSMMPATAWAAEKSNDLVVLYTNDVHCQVDQVTSDTADHAVTNIGYAGVAALKKEMQAQYNNVVLVDAGDHLQGGPIGTLSKGAYLVDIMNQVGYDYAAIGNHEFDYGIPQLLTNIKAAHYQYLSCNFARTDGAAIDGVKAYDIKEYNGVKVAFIGISTPESFTKSTPTYFQDSNGNYIYTFSEGNNGQDLYKKVQASIDAAKSAGAEFIIAISHLGTDPASSPWTSKNVIANTTGLNVVLDGHSHSTIPAEEVADRDGTPVLLSSTGTKLAAIGKLVFNTTDKTAAIELVTGYAAQDETAKSAIAGIEGKYNELLSMVVAHSNVALTTKTPDGSKRAIRNAETNLGDLCADAYRVQLNADIAIVNGGGIRADIAAGDITYGQIINVHPFGNMACMVRATGQQIVDALEMAARNYPAENGGFLQVAGLTYNINPDVSSTVKVDAKGMFVSVDGARRVENVKVLDVNYNQYVPVDLSKTYKLASHNYMLKSGGDGLNMFMKDKVLLDEVKIDNQVLIDYIKDNLNGAVGAEYANLEGQKRITVCNHSNGGRIVGQQAATCSSEGYTGDLVCNDCGIMLSPGIMIPPTDNHNFVNGVCTVCGYISYDITSQSSTAYAVPASSSVAVDLTPVTLHINADISKFVAVKVDYHLISPESFSVLTGSTIISFTPEYLRTLSVGNHTIAVIFTDGVATANLKVTNASSSSESDRDKTVTGNTNDAAAQVLAETAVSPSTGDDSHPTGYIVIGTICLLGLGVVAAEKKKKQS